MIDARKTLLALTAAVVVGLSSTAHAGFISGTNAAITGAVDTQVLNTGVQLLAWNVNGNSSPLSVVNGITFANTAPSVTTSGLATALIDQAGNEAHYTPVGLKAVMGDFVATAGSGASGSLTFNSILTIGRTYRVQMLHHQDINDTAPTQRDMEVHFGTTAGPGTGAFNVGDNVGRITTIVFTADAISQQFSFRAGTNDRAILNGLTLFELVPEVAVSGNAVDIADGDATPSLLDFTDFGETVEGSPIQRIFRVDNLGQIAMTTSALAVPVGFSIIEGLSASIAAGGFDTFTVQLDALATGVYSGQISFTNSDSNENPFNFTITGEVAPAPAALPAGLALTLAIAASRRRRSA